MTNEMYKVSPQDNGKENAERAEAASDQAGENADRAENEADRVEEQAERAEEFAGKLETATTTIGAIAKGEAVENAASPLSSTGSLLNRRGYIMNGDC